MICLELMGSTNQSYCFYLMSSKMSPMTKEVPTSRRRYRCTCLQARRYRHRGTDKSVLLPQARRCLHHGTDQEVLLRTMRCRCPNVNKEVPLSRTNRWPNYGADKGWCWGGTVPRTNLKDNATQVCIVKLLIFVGSKICRYTVQYIIQSKKLLIYCSFCQTIFWSNSLVLLSRSLQ